MRFASLLVISVALFLLGEPDARADPMIELEAGLRTGYGTNPVAWASGVNPYGFGLGGRAGLSVDDVWFGFNAIYYFGGNTPAQLPYQQSPLGGSGDVASIDASALLIGVELGYTLPFIPFVKMRPLVGLGNASISAGDAAGQAPGSTSHLYLEPGLTMLVPLGPVFFGVDANTLITTSPDVHASFTFHAQFGFRFGATASELTHTR